jgi:hypothetical protein
MTKLMRDRLYDLDNYERMSKSAPDGRHAELVRDINDLLKGIMEYFGFTEEDLRKEMNGKTT